MSTSPDRKGVLPPQDDTILTTIRLFLILLPHLDGRGPSDVAILPPNAPGTKVAFDLGSLITAPHLRIVKGVLQ